MSIYRPIHRPIHRPIYRPIHRCSWLSLLLLACGPELAGSGVDDSSGADESSGESAQPADVPEACALLFARRVDYDRRCTGAPFPAADARPFIDACVGFATAPGSELGVAEITACADQLGDACVFASTYPDCVGDGPDMLYPYHDLHGSGAPGAPCFAQVQCASGHCSAVGGSCGRCQRARAPGETCDGADDLCVDASCSAGVCELPGSKLGETCIDYGSGECQAPLYCHNDGDVTQGVCKLRGQLGAACSQERECATDLLCDGDVCVARLADGAACGDLPGACASGFCADGVCGVPEAGRGVGEPCALERCRNDLICQDNVCQEFNTVEAGGACANSSQAGDGCVAGLYCQLDCEQGSCEGAGVCRVLPGVGETCGFLGDCDADATCVDFGFDDQHHQTGVCQRRGAAGDACPCGDFLACVNGRCTPYGAALCE